MDLKEIARIIREAAPYLTEKMERRYEKAADEIEQMRCENCRWWAFDGHVGAPLWECVVIKDEDGNDYASVLTCGPDFYCKHYEKR